MTDDLTWKSLNQMIEAAGRDDLQVVRASQVDALDRVLALLQQATVGAREAIPGKPKGQWSAADEIKVAEWLVLDRVTREARRWRPSSTMGQSRTSPAPSPTRTASAGAASGWKAAGAPPSTTPPEATCAPHRRQVVRGGP